MEYSYGIIVLIILFVINITMPNKTRRDIVYGIRVPENSQNNEEVKSIHRYYKYMTWLNFFGSLVVLALLKKSDGWDNGIISIIPLLVFSIVQTIIYIIANHKVKKLKIDHHLNSESKNVVIVTTKPTHSLMTFKKLWPFFFAVILAIITMSLNILKYEDLPNQIIMQWDMAGNPTRVIEKSYQNVLILPILMVLIDLLMFVIFMGIGYAKRQIDVDNPEISLKKNDMFKSKIMIYLMITLIFIEVALFIGNLSMFEWFNIGSSTLTMFVLIGVLVISFISIFYILQLGQGGSRIKLKEEEQKPLNRNRDDDKYWVLGIFYYNREDPSVFVEKRFGIGYTLNMARKESILFFILIIGIVIFAVTMA